MNGGNWPQFRPRPVIARRLPKRGYGEISLFTRRLREVTRLPWQFGNAAEGMPVSFDRSIKARSQGHYILLLVDLTPRPWRVRRR
jgi:hypothetical protein